jgi:hypothetical protein
MAIEVGNPSNSATADVTIRDTLQLTLTADRSEVYEQPGVPNTITYTITGAPGTTVDLAIAAGSVADAIDILSTNLPDNHQLTLDANGKASFTVTAAWDNLAEISELFRAMATEVGNPGNSAIAEVTIRDVPPLTLTADRSEVYEQPGELNTITYTLTGAAGTTVDLAIATGSVADVNDILSTNLPDNHQLTLDANGRASFTVTAAWDNLIEVSELFRAMATEVGNPGNSATADVTIRNTTQLALTADRSEVYEQPGTNNTITYTVTGAAGTVVELAIAAGSMAKASDISTSLPSNHRLTLDANGKASFTVTGIQDNLIEGSELLRFIAAEAGNAGNNATADVTIRNTTQLALTADRSEVYEQPGTNNTITYTVTGAAGTVVDLAIAAGSVADADDILTDLPSNNRLTLDANGKASFTVTAAQDNLIEGNELLRFAATEAGNAGNSAAADVTIRDIFQLTYVQDILTGTDDNDLFMAPLANVVSTFDSAASTISVQPTLNSFDVIDGGLGWDTLDATLTTIDSIYAPTLSNIENLNIATDGGSLYFDLTNTSGITHLSTVNTNDTYANVTISASDSSMFDNIFISDGIGCGVSLVLNTNYHPQSDAHLNFVNAGTGMGFTVSASSITIDVSNQTEAMSFHLNGYDGNTLIGGSGDDYFIDYNLGYASNSFIDGGAGNYDVYWMWAENYHPVQDNSLINVERIRFASSISQTIDLSSQSEGFWIEFGFFDSGDSITLGNSASTLSLNYWDSVNPAQRINSVSNFQSGDDHIEFSNYSASSLFTSLPKSLSDANFVANDGPVAADADDYLLYHTITGMLSYDADGSGTAAPIEVLELVGAPTLLISDFSVV